MPNIGPLLTIAMPVLNGGQHLRLAVQSIVNQTFTDWELLLIDDGSTDGAIDKLVPKLDPRIRLISDKLNKGLAARLNEAIALARGTFFARMDHDDICHPDRFMHQIAYLEANPSIDLLGALCVTIDDNNRVTGALPVAITHAEICRRPWLGFYLPHPTWIGRTAWFNDHHYKHPAPYRCEDHELLLRASSDSVFHTLPKYLLAYRRGRDTTWKKMARNRLALFKEKMAYFLRNRLFRYAALTFAAFIMRMGADAINKIARRVGISPQLLTSIVAMPDDSEFWNAHIKMLKTQTDWSLHE